MKNALFLIIALVFCACDNVEPDYVDPDGSTDSDSDTDTDTDTDGDIDTDTCPDEWEDSFDPNSCPNIDVNDTCLRFVDPDNTTPGNGTSWETSFNNVQPAIDSSRCCALINGAGEVWIKNGLYRSCAGCRTDTIKARYAVDIFGGFAGGESSVDQRNLEENQTVFSGEYSEEELQIFSFHVMRGANDVVIDGITVTGGRANGEESDRKGAGLFTVSGNMFIYNCHFSLNVAAASDVGYSEWEDVICQSISYGNGGAIFIGGSLIIDNSFFEYNISVGGGAVSAHSVTATNSEFSNNSAMGNSWGTACEKGYGDHSEIYGNGGAIAANSVFLENCTFNHNASVQGGALSINTAQITRSVFRENTAFGEIEDSSMPLVQTGSGGAVFSPNGGITAENSVFFSNQSYRGGAVGVQSFQDNHLLNCVFYKNESTLPSAEYCEQDPGSGSALYSTEDATTEIINSIFFENLSDDSAHISINQTTSQSVVQDGYPGTGNIDADPLFINAPNGDFRLQAGSPCIDAADGDAAPATDIEGNPRVDDPATADTGVGSITYADMGAFEYQP